MDTVDGILHFNYPTTSLEAFQACLFNMLCFTVEKHSLPYLAGSSSGIRAGK
jgi:hypothetical protein